ncbi:MAG: bifunctional precorrin-2 dehydrogenase/sirohydrochlorin ferrochelatase [Acidobacteriia bacterium]|nr:bifunctional precorrin-2 dehydrogenase/sirohydrochlorin ferrochelatase [Terriglobia bacterium]
MSKLFPIFLKLQGRRALVVGGGTMAALRVKQLIAAEAQVTVIAPTLGSAMAKFSEAKQMKIHSKKFEPADLTREYFLAIAATDDTDVNAAVAAQAERLGILYNAVDDIEHSSFYTPSVVERGDLLIAISTNGHSPVLARRLRQEFEQALPTEFGAWVQELGRLRKKLKQEIPHQLEARKAIIEEVIERTVRK